MKTGQAKPFASLYEYPRIKQYVTVGKVTYTGPYRTTWNAYCHLNGVEIKINRYRCATGEHVYLDYGDELEEFVTKEKGPFYEVLPS